MLGPMLVSLHNVTFYQRLLRQARESIRAGRFEALAAEKLHRWAGLAG